MPMSDGRNVLKKIAFQVGDRFFRFAINPENMQYARPHRTTAIKTKSRIIIEDFQSDIPTITIEGTTGFNPTGKASDRGIAKIKEMKNYLEEYAKMGGNGNTTSEDFYFHDFTNDDSFVVHLSPEGVTYTQDVNQPLLHRYRIKFVVLRRAGEPADEDVIQPEIGNRRPSIGGITGDPRFNPNVPNNAIPMPSPNIPNTTVPMPSPVIPGTGGGINIPPVGGVGGDDFYNSGTGGMYTPDYNPVPVNPQAPSQNSYQYGMNGLGFMIGYYGRSYSV